MKKIVIFDTAVCTSNMGDDIILSAAQENMREIFNQGTSMRLGTHVANFTPLQMMRNGFKVDFCKNADVKFICGTNIVSQKMIGKINAQWQLKLYNRGIYKNSVMVGVGAAYPGEKLDPYARFLYKSILSKEYIHSVRDEQTKRIIESLGVKAINTGCPTLWKLTPEFCKHIPSQKAENCVFTVSGHKEQQDRLHDQKMINIIRRNYNKCWLWVQTTEDEKYFNGFSNIEGVEKIYTLDKFKEILENENVDYIGTRLHGGVFALQHAVRSIVVCIDHRAKGFNETNNLPTVMRTNIEKELESKIQSEFETRISINEENIRRFKEQFV